MKVFASPGIDSVQGEFGIFNSDAGNNDANPVASFKRKGTPNDWSSRNPVWGLGTGRLIGNFPQTQAPNAKSLRIRRRSVSPWHGFYNGTIPNGSKYRNDSADSMLNVGGTADLNPGADSMIAGGPGAASSMVRIRSKARKDRGMKLPVLPDTANRSGRSGIPMGGTSNSPSAPITPRMLGLPSIVKIRQMPGGK